MFFDLLPPYQTLKQSGSKTSKIDHAIGYLNMRPGILMLAFSRGSLIANYQNIKFKVMII